MKGELKMMKYKYRGLVKNRLNGEVRKTRYYSTYEKAHRRAERLGQRLYGRNDNWGIDVIAVEEGKK